MVNVAFVAPTPAETAAVVALARQTGESLPTAILQTMTGVVPRASMALGIAPTSAGDAPPTSITVKVAEGVGVVAVLGAVGWAIKKIFF